MTLPTHIDDREMQKFHDVSAGVTAVKTVGSDGTDLAKSSLLPTALGQTTMAASLAAVVASNQSDVPVKLWGNTAAISPRKTFSAAANFAPDASPTDIFEIYGSASKTIYVTKVVVSGTQNTAGTADMLLLLRSTANSGGTSSTLTNTPHVAGDTATAVVKSYTLNPTTGTLIGNIHYEKLYMPTTTGPCLPLIWQANNFCKPVALTSAAMGLCVNFAGVSRTGNSVCVAVEWFEI